jgi:peptidoglycan-associated lipoprotein
MPAKLAPVLTAAATALALAACASHPKPTPVAQAAPAPRAQPPGTAPAAPIAQASTAPVPGSERDFTVNVGDRVYFDYDQYAIRDDAKPLLSAQAQWLVRYPAVKIRIEGNCDERGTEEYNLALGARRASQVRDILVAQGVAPDRISTVSYGKERPIDTGDNETAWAHNRNGHTAIIGGAGQG